MVFKHGGRTDIKAWIFNESLTAPISVVGEPVVPVQLIQIAPLRTAVRTKQAGKAGFGGHLLSSTGHSDMDL